MQIAADETWQPKVLGNSGAARALAYTLRRRVALARYAKDGRYPIDNNAIEKIVWNDLSRQPRRGEAQGCIEQNATRPIALGKRNWLFAG